MIRITSISIFLAVFLSGCAVVSKPDIHMEKQRFVILYSPGPAWLAGKPIWEQPLQAHGDYVHKLYLRGVLVMAGPFTDSTGGMDIIDVTDEKEANAILAGDPAVQENIFTAHLHPWFSVDWKNYGSQTHE
jgi:uncharacterized protein